MADIRDYFLIGDLHTAALVSNHASIDWLCLPHFDGPSLFGRVLDPRAGRFALAMPTATVAAAYRGNTAIVDFTVADGAFTCTLTDFMLPQPREQCEHHVLVRKLRGTHGAGEVRFVFDPQPDYGRQEPRIQRGEAGLELTLNPGRLRLHLPSDARIEAGDHGQEIIIPLRVGEQRELVLHHLVNPADEGVAVPTDKEDSTVRFWREWNAAGNPFAATNDAVLRSMVTLKLMQFYPTGALIAAPTTSLPADAGGERNWDYRYVWLRDATFVVYAFYILDRGEEAVRFFNYVKDRCRDDDFDVRLMYTITGEHVPREVKLEHLAGYRDSRPVRIGNDAAQQFQLDVYGALIDMHYLLYRKTFDGFAVDRPFIMAMVEKIAANWQRPDSGIWEARNEPKHYTYSKVMAWVGIDRTLRMQAALKLDEATVARLERLRTEIHDWIWQHCFDAERTVLRQHPDTDEPDATNFLFVLLRFLDKHDPRTRAILETTERALAPRELFVRRYTTSDGIAGRDHAFVLCTFWMIAAYAITGQSERAARLFDDFQKHISPTGLLAEQMDEVTGAYLGNYPQAFSHLGLVMSAYYLQRYRQQR